MIHPFKQYRVSGKRRYSLNDVADITGLTRTAIIRTEQGLYTRPPEKLLDLIRDICVDSNNTGCSTDELLEQYRGWQKWKRKQAGPDLLRALHAFIDNDWQYDFTLHPFAYYLKRSFPKESQIGRAKKLAVHQSTLMKYEAGRTPYMPEQIRDSLRDAGLTPAEIRKLDALGMVYFNDRSISQ